MIRITVIRANGGSRVFVSAGGLGLVFNRLADVKADPRFRCYRIILDHRCKGAATGRLVNYAEWRERERYAQNIRDEAAIRAEAPFRDWRY